MCCMRNWMRRACHEFFVHKTSIKLRAQDQFQPNQRPYPKQFTFTRITRSEISRKSHLAPLHIQYLSEFCLKQVYVFTILKHLQTYKTCCLSNNLDILRKVFHEVQLFSQSPHMIMIPTISNEDTNNKAERSKMSALTMVESDNSNSKLLAKTTSPLVCIFKRGTDMKFHFGFLKRRHTEGTLCKNNSKQSPPTSSSVRPQPEEAAKWSNSFHDLMNSKYGQTLFKAFLKREFSEENIEFWMAIEDYHQTTRQNKLSHKAQKIFNEFILPQSPKEINLDSLTRQNLINKMNHESPTHTTFDQAQKRTQSLLEADAYSRFLTSELYMELLHPDKYRQ